MDIYVVVLTSATVAAAVSGLFTLVSQILERRARKDELLFKTATELAVKYTGFGLEIVKKSGQKAEFPPYGWLIYAFHRELKHLMTHSELPHDSQQEMEKWLKSAGLKQ